jgi:GH25 family lysozyme M1 (1,4-beta-N-acetylmuramidase)
MGVCSYAVWQYSEEGIAEGSRRILLKNAVMVMGS